MVAEPTDAVCGEFIDQVVMDYMLDPALFIVYVECRHAVAVSNELANEP